MDNSISPCGFLVFPNFFLHHALYKASVFMCSFLAMSWLLLPSWSPCCHLLPETFKQNIAHNTIYDDASSAKHPKLKFFQPFKIWHFALLGQLSGWKKYILLSSECGSQSGHALLAGASSLLPFWRKDRDHSLWMASSGRFEAPTGDLQERKGKLDGPERS